MLVERNDKLDFIKIKISIQWKTLSKEQEDNLKIRIMIFSDGNIH